jgi:hypothetical protein
MDVLSKTTAVSRAAGISGAVAVVLNVAAVVFLREQPHAYQPGDLEPWRLEVLAHPLASSASAWSFTVGLCFLVVFTLGLALTALEGSQRRGALLVGGTLLALGALLDAVGTPAVAVVAQHLQAPEDGAAGRALLGFTLNLDATFNLLLGLGLLLLAASVPSPRWLRLLGFAAGAVTVPVAAQAVSAQAISLLAVSGPLWLAWVTAHSVMLLKRR